MEDSVTTRGSKAVKVQYQKFSWTPKPILADDVFQDLPLLEAFVGKIKNKTDTAKVISELSKTLPCPKHLKRCASSAIYLAPAQNFAGDPMKLKEFLGNINFNTSLLEDNFYTVKVPAVPPKTKSHMNAALKYWPVHFHQDCQLEALLSGNFFNEQEMESIEFCMKIAIKAAENAAVGCSSCNGSAVIINPEEGNILAVAASSIHKHPMWHAAMLAVDLVAKSNGGGVWNIESKFWNSGNLKLKRKHSKADPFIYPETLPNFELHKINKLRFSKIHAKNKDIECIGSKSGPYLCTNYWVFLIQEPCPMCAMALLHSRVSMIFYGVPNPKMGILGSRASLHLISELNHRYLVWSGVLESECARIVNICKSVDS